MMVSIAFLTGLLAGAVVMAYFYGDTLDRAWEERIRLEIELAKAIAGREQPANKVVKLRKPQ